ncbi:MAG: efflux RND transporter periplasmic adaptor subunit [Bryobacteraceae bacterium]|jgi:membrane fusion protein (multidrug efflux system)
MTHSRRASFYFIPALALLSLAAGGCRQQAAPAAMGRMAPEVSVTPVAQRDVPVLGEWVATLDGYVNAQIQPQVSGYLIRQNYQEGSFVREGQVLFEIDPRPFEAVLDQARGALAQARGSLAQARGAQAQATAQLELAQINVRRDTPLAKARAIAQSQLDSETQVQKTAEANILTAQAGIETAQASIESAQAAIRTTELNLGFTKVRSLVDGVAGMAAVQIGNLVGPSTVLTTVSKVDPIKVYFPITEQEYLHVSGLSKTGRGDGWLRRAVPIPLQLTLSDGSVYPHTGHIVFTDRQVDSQTGTIRIVAAFPNPGNILRPGQFGRVSAVKESLRGALVVPQRAVSNFQGQYQVAVVGADNKVSVRNVTVGPRLGSLWVIESGVAAGERVVTEGTAKAPDGAVVSPKAATAAETAGQPKEH